MRFCDKLIQLRKRNGFSQEELGEKLNVTRQTVSKWELNQSKPDTDKLLEISKLFNVDFNLLLDDNKTLENNKNEHFDSNDLKPRKWLLVVLIIIAIIIIVILGGKFISGREDKKENSGIFDIFDRVNGIGKEMFNNTFDFYLGTKNDILVNNLIDEIIKNNKTNKEHIITVKYNDITTTDTTEIKNIKNKISDSKKYEISAEYDENGYINEIIIEIYNDPSDIKHFNFMYEFYNGTNRGTQIKFLLDKVITNNKTNKEQIIRVVYNTIDSENEEEIRNIKKSLDDWTEYEVILEYDEIGYIYMIKIEK